MEATSESSSQLSSRPKSPKIHDRRRRRRNHNPEPTNGSTNRSNNQDDPDGRARHFHRNPMERQPPAQISDGVIDTPEASGSRPVAVNNTPGGPSTTANRGRRNPNYRDTSKRTGDDAASSATPNRAPQTGRRGAKFNAGLTEPSADTATSSSVPPKRSYNFKKSTPKNDDLTSSLIRALSTPPYPDCPICFVAIHPNQPTWSCSPSRASNTSESDVKDNETSQCCWTTFHLKCIRSWAGKSVKEISDAWRARGEEHPGEWRCPGCQFKRELVPSGYWCFCGSTAEPKPRLGTPHSCANPCSRHRVCGHPCSLACHPGPCPPCQISTQLPCYCGKQIQSFRCSHLAPGSIKANLSCSKKCGKKLGCGNHTCHDLCHAGDCQPCAVIDIVRCYCGKGERNVTCGEGEEKECAVNGTDGTVEKWTGRFQCENNCERYFDCGKHHCSKPCHPPSLAPPPCPRSPSLVTHCPCGKHPLDVSSAISFSQGSLLSRTSCSDPIPSCTSICMRPLEHCSHVCSTKCHTGPCPPCSIMVVRPCRCGATTKDIRCYDLQAGTQPEILCSKSCTALRACGRHQCNRVCCPLASLAGPGKGKGKKRAPGPGLWDEVGMDETGLHECDLVCGKPLACGNHRCEQRDHRGVCPPCLMSSFEETICHCGRTVLEPPVPCGTLINCTYPCSRPPLACGHPKSNHSCHEDPSPCPPCPFLTNKLCACGKKTVGNVKCSQEKEVSCGITCGKLLGCGFHHCERLCHSDDCGSCSSVCGKSRKLCLPAHHPCALPCHAPSTCSEAEPCRAIVTLSCSCGRIRQSTSCERSTSNPDREGVQQLKCTNECLVAKRNARLAEALGISTEDREKPVTYHDELITFARSNVKFLGLVEKSFAEFVLSEKKTQVLPHMPMERRKFVHDLAAVYRMDVQMVDQEPHRSVQLIRRIDTRIPSPTLSSTIMSSTAPKLGKLVDLRASSGPSLQPLRPPSSTPSRTSTPVGSSQRGWTSVIGRPAIAAKPHPSMSSWAAPQSGKLVASQTAVINAQPASTTSSLPSLEVSSVDVPDSWEDDV